MRSRHDLCAIVDKQETDPPSALEMALRRIRGAHAVHLLDVGGLSGPQAIAREEEPGLADLYLMKSRTPQALDFARHVERRGGLVVNGSRATLSCLDRMQMAARLREADVPRPETWSFATLESLLVRSDLLASLPFPLIIKSRGSRRGDLVDRVDDVGQLHDLRARWGREPVVVQGFEPNDGWDLKIWVIDKSLFAARRRTSLDAEGSKENIPVSGDLPGGSALLALGIGRVFDLHIYGVDFVLTGRGPVVVDVNAFPGFRGVPGAGDALASLAERLAGAGKAAP